MTERVDMEMWWAELTKPCRAALRALERGDQVPIEFHDEVFGKPGKLGAPLGPAKANWVENGRGESAASLTDEYLDFIAGATDPERDGHA